MPDSEKVILKAEEKDFSPFRRGPDDSHLALEMEAKLKELEAEMEKEKSVEKKWKE